MGLACTCKSQRKVQGKAQSKMQWESATKKGNPSAGLGLGLDLKIEAMWAT